MVPIMGPRVGSPDHPTGATWGSCLVGGQAEVGVQRARELNDTRPAGIADGVPWATAGWVRSLIVAAGTAIAYGCGSFVAFEWFQAGSGLGPTFFPAAGLTLAALVLLPGRLWPAALAGIVAGEIGSDLLQGLSAPAALGFAVANTVEPVVGAALLRRFVGRVDLSRRRQLAAFFGCAVIIGPVVGGVVAATGQDLLGTVPTGWGAYVLHWWVGDGLGVLVVGGAILARANRSDPARGRARTAEGLALVAVTVASTFAVFWLNMVPLAYIPLLLLVWTAFRVGTDGVALAGAGLAFVCARAAATDREGVDLILPASMGLLYLQLLIMVAIGTALVLAVEVAERERTTVAWSRAEAGRDNAVRLQQVAAELAAAVSVADVTRVVVRYAADLVGTPAAVGLPTGAGDAVVATSGDEGVSPPWPALSTSLVAGDRVVGTLRVALPHEGAPTPAESDLLATLADIGAQAIARAQLYESEHEAGRRAEALRRVAVRLAGALEPDEAAEIIATEAAAGVNAASAAVILVNRTGSFRVISGHGAVGDHVLAEPNVSTAGATISAAAITSRSARFASSMDELRKRYPASATVAARLGLSAVAAIPLYEGEALVGVLSIGFAPPTAFDAPLRDFIERLARECEQALARAALFQRQRLRYEQAESRQRLVSALFRAGTQDEIARAASAECLDTLGASTLAITVRGPDGNPSFAMDSEEMQRRVHETEPNPSVGGSLTEWVMDNGRPAYAPDADELARGWPVTAARSARIGLAAAAAVPLRDETGVVGALTIGYSTPQAFDRDTTAYVELVASDIEQALVRSRLEAAERDARRRASREAERFALLAAIGRELEGVPTVRSRLERLVAALVPRLADFAVVRADVPDSDHELVLSRHHDPARQADLDRLVQPTSGSAEPAAGSAGLAGLADLGPVAEITVPLRMGKSAHATLLLGRHDPGGRAFTAEEVDLLRAVGQRAALSLENALLYEAEHRIAVELQATLLGAPPNDLEGISVGSYYGPGEAGLHAGGDWYQVVALGPEAWGFAIGDVPGHGLRAAAAMGQLRIALAALAPFCRHPGEVLQRLDLFANGIEGTQGATVAFVVLDRSSGTLTYACAGQLPPLLVSASAAGRYLWDGRSAPLGLTPAQSRPYGHAEMKPGDLLVLYTDGLIERRDEIIDTGLRRLEESASRLFTADTDATGVSQNLVASLVGRSTPSDDVAVLTIRLDDLAPPP
jgi:serine phosphatase RsbU (regulator of sigma subunit)/integral membrane sensor domain MASE1